MKRSSNTGSCCCRTCPSICRPLVHSGIDATNFAWWTCPHSSSALAMSNLSSLTWQRSRTLRRALRLWGRVLALGVTVFLKFTKVADVPVSSSKCQVFLIMTDKEALSYGLPGYEDLHSAWQTRHLVILSEETMNLRHAT